MPSFTEIEVRDMIQTSELALEVIRSHVAQIEKLFAALDDFENAGQVLISIETVREILSGVQE